MYESEFEIISRGGEKTVCVLISYTWWADDDLTEESVRSTTTGMDMMI